MPFRPSCVRLRAGRQLDSLSRSASLVDPQAVAAAVRRCVPSASGLYRRVVAATALLGSLVWAEPAFASNAVPDWVRTAAAQPVPPLPPSTKAVVLLDEETYTVHPDGQATLHVRNVVKVLRPQGRRYAEPVLWQDKDSRITSIHIWSIDPAGHEYALKDDQIVEVGMPGEGGNFFEDLRAKYAAPPGRDPGGVVAYEFEQRERPYVAETSWDFQDNLPRLTQSLTLVLPPGYHFSTAWAHHQRVEPMELPGNALRWQMDHEPAVDVAEIPLAPSEGALAARMTVHYSGPGIAASQDGSWRGIGQWYDGLSHDRLAATSDVAAKAAELTAGKTDFYDKAEAIGEFVQKQIRYFVVEMGVGGYQPHSAQDILRGRYGDCKDKATLLSAMLSSVGIHAALMMVDTHRGYIDPAAPSKSGNHMIAAIQIPAGYTSPRLRSVITAQTGKRYLIFDPTAELTPFGQLESELQDSEGLLVEGADSQIVRLPVLSPDLNRVERTGTFTLLPDGTLKGSVAEKRFGDLASQARFVSKLDAKTQQEFLDSAVSRDVVSATLSGLTMENANSLNQDLSVKYRFEAGHYASATGPMLIVRPRVLGTASIPIDRKPRRVAIDLGETMQDSDSFDIELPDGYAVDELPEPVKVDLDFATYESSTELRGHTLHYARSYRLKVVTLPAERYPDLQKLAGLIAADEQNRAVLKRSN